MNPLQKNKIDIKSLSPEEQRLFRLYGKLPSRSDHFAKHLKERKYFDSGDYAMSKAGKGDSVDTGAVGSEHPVPENIPHLAANPVNGSGIPKHVHSSIPGVQAGSPVKESSFLNRETSAEGETIISERKKEGDVVVGNGEVRPAIAAREPVTVAAAAQGMPVRQ